MAIVVSLVLQEFQLIVQLEIVHAGIILYQFLFNKKLLKIKVVIDVDETGKLLETKTCVTCIENAYPGA